MDYRRLNIATVNDTYPLPRIDDTLAMLAGKQWFSTLDLASGYWQVSLSQEARTKSAFLTHSGLFQFKIIPFGLCNAPATFERLMDRVLQGLRWSRCLVYMDDIISFGSTFGDALDNLTLIFERLRAYGLQFKSTKCHLFQSSVPFWDIPSVVVALNATQRRSRTSNHGRSRIVLRMSVSSLLLSVITKYLYLILLTSRPLWWP